MFTTGSGKVNVSATRSPSTEIGININLVSYVTRSPAVFASFCSFIIYIVLGLHDEFLFTKEVAKNILFSGFFYFVFEVVIRDAWIKYVDKGKVE